MQIAGSVPDIQTFFIKKSQGLGQRHEQKLRYELEVEPNMLTKLPGSLKLRVQNFYTQNKNKYFFFCKKKKKRVCLGQKRELNLKFKLEVEPNTLTEPPDSFNLREQNFL